METNDGGRLVPLSRAGSEISSAGSVDSTLFDTDFTKRAALRLKIRDALGSQSLEVLERIATLLDAPDLPKELPDNVVSLDAWRRRDG